MARMTYLDYQMHQRMEQMKAIGESRHVAKEEYRQMIDGNSNNKTLGIHSFNTYSAYKQTSTEFIKYIRQNHNEIKNIGQISREHIIEYLVGRQGEGKSAYTISKDMAALNKLFNTTVSKKEAGIKERSYKDVSRSREPKSHDKKYNPQNYREQIAFARATGCRRESVLRIKPEDFILDKSGLPQMVYLKEKGGKERHATILEEYRETLKELIKGKEEGVLLFSRYTKKIDNHAFRAEYAKERYREIIKSKGTDKKDFRGFDKECLKILTRDLGHNRLDIVIYHYLR